MGVLSHIQVPHGNTADPFALLRRDQRHKCAPASPAHALTQASASAHANFRSLTGASPDHLQNLNPRHLSGIKSTSRK
uniref:Uncharacterized protein n=1 Tax=Anguilla anguilla TaxID=7936 RepID=A0A0E9SK61_ANGAN